MYMFLPRLPTAAAVGLPAVAPHHTTPQATRRHQAPTLPRVTLPSLPSAIAHFSQQQQQQQQHHHHHHHPQTARLPPAGTAIAMFRPLTLWQNIPCPALDARGSCTVTHCLFSHARAPAAPPPRLPPAPPPPAPPAPHPPRPNAPVTSTTPLPPPPPLSLVAALSGDPRLRKIIEANANASPTPPTPPSDDGCDHKRRRALDDPAPPPPPPGPDNSAAAGVAVDADADSSHPPATKRTRTRVDTAPKSILKKSPQTAAAPPKTTTTNGAGGKAGATATATATLPKSAVPQQGPSAPPPHPPPATATAKPLSLNPRLVPSAPATHAARLKLLTLLHGEYVRLHAGHGDAQAVLKLALDEEEKVAREMRSIYSQAMKKRIVKLKNTAPADFARAQAKKQEQEEEEGRRRGGAGGGGGGSRTAQGRAVDHGLDNEKPPLDTGLAPDQELRALAPLLQVPAELAKYKYILEPPTAAEVEAAARGTAAAGGWEACDRCSSRFQVFDGRRESDGQLASGGKCTYHWGRAAWPSRSSGNRAPKDTERIFTCCRQRVGQSAGCTTCDNHVYKISEAKRLASLWQFIKTPAPAPAPAPAPSPPGPGPPAKKPIARALCVDCEMCYTTHGMELIRLTATAFPSGHTVIDALVRPAGGILDLNTRFSGVSSAQLVAAAPHTPLPYPPLPASAADYLSPTTATSSGGAAAPLQILPSPEAARALLLRYVDAETPLVGHALENDLGVLRLCHACVVDTAVLFPHARGLPMRNKLKYLVERYLERRIQVEEDAGGEGGEGARAAAMAARGHDSAVDARCAGELVRWKIREEMVLERAGRRVKGG